MAWNHRVKVKHLFTKKEDHESVQVAMNAVADVLEGELCFNGFSDQIKLFREIPQGNTVLGSVDFANELLNRMYDYADLHRILIN